MHEVSIMQEILDVAFDYAQRERAIEITEITITIGKMSGVVPLALEFAFSALIQDTLAHHAQLKINLLPLICHCDFCQENFMPNEWFFLCPKCEQLSNKIIQGKEIQLTSLKVS